jgi:hypothetical protein
MIHKSYEIRATSVLSRYYDGSIHESEVLVWLPRVGDEKWIRPEGHDAALTEIATRAEAEDIVKWFTDEQRSGLQDIRIVEITFDDEEDTTNA